MGRFFNRLTYLLAILSVVYAVYGHMQPAPDGGARRPPPRVPPPSAGAPAPGGREPVVVIDVGELTSSTGSGFAIGEGWWLTARHVVDGCDVAGILVQPREGVKAREVLIHPAADLALLAIPASRPLFPLASRDLRVGEDGFSIGYPHGEPGAIHGRLLGTMRMRSVGRYRIEEPIVVWAERTRIPDDLPSLGGLSGGPMFDRSGAVVGVLVAESQRRGRVMTTAPSSIEALLAQSHLTPRRGPGEVVLSDGNLTAIGQNLRKDLRVAKVVCQVGGATRRMRR